MSLTTSSEIIANKMRVPHTIPKNVFEGYRCSEETILLPREQSRTIRAENSTWDDSVIPELRLLALRVLVEVWQYNPILEKLPTCVDTNALLEILPIDLPFNLIIERIPHEYYWGRIAKHRWEYNNPEDHDNSWRQLYCERHLAEYLECLEPDHFQSQQDECEELVKRVQPYVRIVKIRSLMPSGFPSNWSADEEGSKERETTSVDEPGHVFNGAKDSMSVHHIPFDTVLSQLSEIRELYLNFGMIYMNDGFEWRDFRFSVEDCVKLGRALKNYPRMEKVSVTRSDLDQPRVAAILQGIVVNNNIKEIDFSHCKLGDTGAHVIGEFLKNHQRLNVLSLENNDIGPSGLAGIVHGLCQDTATPLKKLNLRLNPFRDDGGGHICALLLRNSTLERLNISGCGFGGETGVGIAEVLSSDCTKFYTMDIDLTNNDLGPLAGKAFEVAMKTCTTVVALAIRMCNFSKESECSIGESVFRNRENRRRERRTKSSGGKKSSAIYIIEGPKCSSPFTESESLREF